VPKPPPESTKISLRQRLTRHAETRWPALAAVNVRYHGTFAYINGQLPDGTTLPLCRLRYGGSASLWGFAIYLASRDGYEDSILPSGLHAGSPEEALETDNVLYCNFEGLVLDTADQAAELATQLDDKFRSLGQRVHVIVNYDNFDLSVPATDTFFAMVRRNRERYSLSTTRYSTNAFYRRRLGHQFAAASLAHSLYGSFADARKGLNRTEKQP
jgi:hypothetical protein